MEPTSTSSQSISLDPATRASPARSSPKEATLPLLLRPPAHLLPFTLSVPFSLILYSHSLPRVNQPLLSRRNSFLLLHLLLHVQDLPFPKAPRSQLRFLPLSFHLVGGGEEETDLIVLVDVELNLSTGKKAEVSGRAESVEEEWIEGDEPPFQ